MNYAIAFYTLERINYSTIVSQKKMQNKSTLTSADHGRNKQRIPETFNNLIIIFKKLKYEITIIQNFFIYPSF